MIYINCLSENELLEMGCFNSDQCANIIRHISEFGPIIHAQELLHCEIDASTIDLIYPKLDFRQSFRQELGFLNRNTNIEKVQFYARMKPPSFNSGVTNELKNWGYESKLKLNIFPALQIGASIESDPGEKPLDFISGYIHYQGKSTLQQVILGNFVCQFNKGLTFGSSGQFGSPLSLENYTYQPVGIKSYSSNNEDVGHFGAAVKIAFDGYEIYTGIGQKKIDCQLNIMGNAFTKRNFGGMHVTTLQQSRRHNNAENLAFITLQKQYKLLHFNATIAQYYYHIPKQIVIGIDTHLKANLSFFEGQITIPKFFYGRWIVDLAYNVNTNSYSHCVAGVYALSKNTNWGIRWIKIDKEFDSPELYHRLTQFKNTHHIESGFDIKFNRKLSVKVRVNHTHFIFGPIKTLNLENDIKQIGILHYEFSKASTFIFQFNREKSFSGDAQNVGRNFMYTYQCSQNIDITKNLKFKWIGMQKGTNFSDDIDHLLSIGIRYNLSKFITLNFEQTWFHAINGNLYQIDHSLPGVLGYMVYSGNGEMNNLVVKFKMNKHLQLFIKLQKMQKMNVKNETEIDESNSYHRIFVQIKFQ